MVWKFENNKYIYTKNDKKIILSGSGGLIIEVNENNFMDSKVILFKSSYNQFYNEPGGRIDKEDFDGFNTFNKVALREIKEETCNLFNIKYNLDNELYIDLKSSNGIYRCYIILIKNFHLSKKIFKYNKALMKNKPSFYNETSDISHFYLNDLLNITEKGAINTEGNFLLIRDRTYLLCKKIISKQNLNKIKQSKHHEIKEKINKSSKCINLLIY